METRNHHVGIAQVELGDSLLKIRARGKFLDKDAMDFVPTPESLHLLIDTPNYDGPLDLLLHLIRKHSMDIFDIPIAQITKKYLEALDEMRALNLDIAGEFLLMAATLTEIKSKMLLPKEQQKEEPMEEDGRDPRLELMKRLLTYKAFQETGQILLKRPLLGRDIFYGFKEEEPEESEREDGPIKPFLIFELLERLSVALKKADEEPFHVVTRDRISVSTRIRELIEYCQIRSNFTFIDALRFFPIHEKVDVIVTFLAILEMTRLKLVRTEMSSFKELIVKVNKDSFYIKQDEILQNLSDRGADYDQ